MGRGQRERLVVLLGGTIDQDLELPRVDHESLDRQPPGGVVDQVVRVKL
jgi:hypothetical protein